MLRLLLPIVFFASAAAAEAPKVVTDIAPVHSLVAMVMDGVGTPTLVVAPGSSPHHHAMRPSEARALAEADLVIWVGPSLTPWMEGPIRSLAHEAQVLHLMDAENAHLLGFREGALFGGHHHGEDPEESAGHGEETHDPSDIDPHVWLDPQNAALFVGAIAEALAGLDPAHADAYQRNAVAAQARIHAQERAIDAQLSALRARSFIVLHDGFHYFEARFGVEAIGAVSASDATTPGAARIKELREVLQGRGLVCGFSEPQVGTELLELVTQGQDVRIGILDPIGTTLEPGPELYLEMMQGIADEMADCLSR